MGTTALSLPELIFRNSIGLSDAMDRTLSAHPNYPPHNIVQTGELAWQIVLAIAGFRREDIQITTHDGFLTIAGQHAVSEKPEGWNFLHTGLGLRDFERRFKLDQWVEVVQAHMADGLLTIDLVRNVPDAQKPKTIAITAD